MIRNRHLKRAWALSLAVFGFATVATGDAPATALERWRSENACGVNCLYVMLDVYGINVNYTQLMGRLIGGIEETSLLDLKRAAVEKGLACEMGKTTPEGLRRATGPVICHCEDELTGRGHFVLVLKSDRDGLVTMDGTTCLLRRLDWTSFDKNWSGYVLYTSPDRMWSGTGLLSVATGIGLGAVAVFAAQGAVRARSSCALDPPRPTQ